MRERAGNMRRPIDGQQSYTSHCIAHRDKTLRCNVLSEIIHAYKIGPKEAVHLRSAMPRYFVKSF
jgi:hypothetical protein